MCEVKLTLISQNSLHVISTFRIPMIAIRMAQIKAFHHNNGLRCVIVGVASFTYVKERKILCTFCRSEINTLSDAILTAANGATNMPHRRKHYRFAVPPRRGGRMHQLFRVVGFFYISEGNRAHYHATHAIVAANSFDMGHPDGHHGDSKSRNYMETILRD